MSYRITVPRTVTINLDFDGQHFLLSHPLFNTDAIKELAAGSWNKKLNSWVLPGYVIYARTALELFPEMAVTPTAQSVLDGELVKWIPIDPLEPAYIVYQERFYPYQREAVDWLVGIFKTCGLTALSPGLGKTVVALVAARLHQFEKVLIVAPKPLLRSWENEAMKFFGEVWFERRHGQVPVLGWNLTNYDTVVGKVIVDKKRKVTGYGDRLHAY